MKASIIAIKIFYIPHLIACIVTEIWYLKTLLKIEAYNDHGVQVDMYVTACLDFFYFFGIIYSLIYIYIAPYTVSGKVYYILLMAPAMSAGYSLIVGARYLITRMNLGEIPFNCNFNYDLPENVKIACKARFISCILDFTLFVSPLVPSIIFLLEIFFSEHDLISYHLQRNLFVL
ncbi:hypothetical protein RclHR1_00160020 [Rhizophagus clarus]|uniref:Uncharacterized protein n=1 Tax=Rhizophagus clarus TaxID=94130 RepID=A0A2Z6QVP2_9GLOM|nr:hypothetical protein RclHR1_00160020 [Rhizophagus clarus]GES81095.1 hypothetical protein GLOIN_2v1870100 [Rhizophagus clarus]